MNPGSMRFAFKEKYEFKKLQKQLVDKLYVQNLCTL